MIAYIWPLGLAVLSNTLYHICCKACGTEMHPFASLTVTYLVGALVSLGLYLCLSNGGNFGAELKKITIAPVLLGVAIVGLEAGFMYAYAAGWQVSSAQLVQSAVLSVLLIAVGALLYGEKITATKVIGIVICLIGLYFVNK